MPMFEEPIHVGRPNLGDLDQFYSLVDGMFDRLWLTNDGPLVQAFEAELAAYLGVRNVVCVTNGTVGLEIAIRALGMTGEVIVPSFTFVATAHGLNWQGLTPVFADIDPVTHSLDPDSVRSLISPRTTGIIPVHLWGEVAPVDAFRELADEFGLKLLYDAAHAFSNSYRSQRVGNFGDAEVFSFHATKFFNSFEGGAVASNDDDLADRVRLMRNFGFAGYDNVVHSGTNGKLTEVCAAMGLANLSRIDSFIEVNRQNYLAYRTELEDVKNVNLFEYSNTGDRNYQYVVLTVDSHSDTSRDELIDLLTAENVLARRYFWPGAHMMEPYRESAAGANLPQTVAIANAVVVLPTGGSVDEPSIRKICSIIRKACG